MLPVAALAFFLCLLIASASPIGRVHFFCALFTLGAFGTHKVLYASHATAIDHVGIASAAPSVAVSSLCVLLLAISGLLIRPGGLGFPVVAPFLFYLTFGVVVLWDWNPIISAGAWHLLIAALGICAGAHLARLTDSVRGTRVFASWVAAVLAAQCLIALAQFLGASIFTNPELLATDATTMGRATGTFFHPSTLGKVAVLALGLALPLLSSRGRRERTLAWVIGGCGFLACIVTGSRANTVALVSTWILWILLSSPKVVRGGLKARVALALIVGVLLTFPYWSARLLSTESGERSHFNDVAMRYLEMTSWWSGVGPNSYVEAVGRTDPLTAAGWPVHNMFLLTTVELGVVGAALFAALIAVPTIRAWSLRRGPGLRGPYALALLAMAPGLLLIVLTGWGMLADALAPWTMTVGYCYWKARFSTIQTDSHDVNPRAHATPPVDPVHRRLNDWHERSQG